MVFGGKSQGEIACIMGVTSHTVKFHLRSVFIKLNAQNGRFAVLKAAAMGLIMPGYGEKVEKER